MVIELETKLSSGWSQRDKNPATIVKLAGTYQIQGPNKRISAIKVELKKPSRDIAER